MQKPAPSSKTVAGTLTGLFAAGSLPGAIVYFSTPVESLDSNGAGMTVWDVDGSAPDEFVLGRSTSTTTTSTFNATLGTYITYTSISHFNYLSGTGNDGRLLRPGGDLSNLAYGANVGPSVTTGFGFGVLLLSNGNLTNPNFSDGVSGYIGFRFGDSDPNLANYGWARITLTENGTFGDAVIHEWAYNTVAGASIAVGAIPEPETAAAGLGALALGVAGLRRWRKKKQQAA
ncbi:MAG: hypothetical protein ACFE0O_02265 [Opitutales bacterium]